MRRIEKLYTRRIPPKEIVTAEFARQLTELSHETRRQIGALIDRKGHVEYVMVGDNRRIELPDFKRVRVATDRFRGLRFVHTHLRGEELTQDDLTDLALLRLDLMVAIDVNPQTGLPGLVRAAHLLPVNADFKHGASNSPRRSPESSNDKNISEGSGYFDPDLSGDESPGERGRTHRSAPTKHGHGASEPPDRTIGTKELKSNPYTFLEPQIPSQLDVDFLALINSLEEEMARNRRTTRRAEVRDRAILVGVTTGSLAEAEESMAELFELATSAGVVVHDEIIQRRPAIDPRTVLGKGKLDELLIRALQLGADMLVFDRELQPAQVRSLSDATDLKIIDRSQLILDIFAQRAQSSEGKIQVELAQLKYLLPRLVIGQDSAFSRLAGGIGGRGPGETKLETDRRRVRDRINRLEKEIEAQRYRRQERRKARTRQGLPVISLVGYTNAGKSTLLNTLTNSVVLAEKRMFATLDPTSRRLRLPREQEVIINDTVGFIRELPPDLLSAFRATLEEISDSNLIIHLVDASNPRWSQQISSVEKILAELHFQEIPRILALNKADLVAPEILEGIMRQATQAGSTECIAIAAINPKSLQPLLEKAGAIVARNLIAPFAKSA
ncbi:MAG TPA: GTPase HflX [Pyrinomonadaceae bacterium]|nr:GTPase HflX [Pyrinomonadaceae bacterium]